MFGVISPWKKWTMAIGFSLAAGYPLMIGLPLPLYRTTMNSYDDRTAILTGATGTLGTAIAKGLAKKNMRVIMACRDMDKCKSIRRELVLLTGNKALACRHLDLEHIDSINKFADEMINTEPHIDILINCAAVKEVKERELTEIGVEKNYFVNFLAPFLLTMRLIDKLKESASITRDSRIINIIGSPKKNWSVDLDDINFDKRRYDPKTAYNQSKLALAYFTILLDKYNREQKNLVFVYGTSPCKKHFLDSLRAKVGLYEHFRNFYQSYYAVHANRGISTVLKCALHPLYSDTSYSGRLYSWCLTSWGWGKAGKDENMAKYIWNDARRMLLEAKKIKSPRKEAPNKKETSKEDSKPENSDKSKNTETRQEDSSLKN